MSDQADRRRHWDQVYRHKADTDVSWFEVQPKVSLELIDGLDLQPATPIIDVGGGASRLVDHLLERGMKVAVLDLSSAALEASRRRLGERAMEVQWVVADITTRAPKGPFVLWHDRAVFHFLTERKQRRRYASALNRALTTGGYAIIATFALDGPKRCSGLPVARYDSDSLQRELGSEFELLAARSERHRTPAGHQQSFQYCLFRKAGESRHGGDNPSTH